MENNYEYTKEDLAILNSYKILSQSLATYLGENVEIILYSFENEQCNIIHIVNEHLSNKKLGSPISDMDKTIMLEILSNNENHKNNFVQSVTGECNKSNYTILKNNYGVPIGMMCINWHFDISVINILSAFIPDNISVSKEKSNNRSEEIILDAIKKVIIGVDRDEVGASVYNKTIIKKLFSQGIFEFKEAVQIVSNYLHISHHTVYLHLRSIKKSKKYKNN
ncbi:helix-turn-helix transcriptional regulator [Brachyspira alvinipulli]|uniref:helix-turn-helix transcriptional regulator n=1 Tax=Brachyspira alvinipulli TaxID=84379 RepID=UPI0009FE15AA|nr:PAS domain-containing protein [Brachyspira alvinipulli]